MVNCTEIGHQEQTYLPRDRQPWDDVPSELKERPQWVAWQTETRDGKPTKVPYNVRTGRRADSTEPDTWSTYHQAVAFWLAHADEFDGIGYVFDENDPYCGIDLDKCRNPETGELQPWAVEMLDDLNSYCEVSPSLTGVKVWVRGRKPGERCKTGYETGAVEMYHTERFFTMTGMVLKQYPATIEERQEQVEKIYNKVFVKAKPKHKAEIRAKAGTVTNWTGSNKLTDSDIVAKASNADNGSKFIRLWNGDISGYKSHSEADLALCSLLAFWTGPDAARIDRLYRDSDLFRTKWERQDYREGTIALALDGRTEYYRGPMIKSAPSSAKPDEGEDAGEVREGANDPHRLARIYFEDKGTNLRLFRGEWHLWTGLVYRIVDEAEIKSELTRSIKSEFDRIAKIMQEMADKEEAEGGEDEDEKPKKKKPVTPMQVTTKLVGNVMLALRSFAILSGQASIPCWVNPPTGFGDGTDFKIPFPAREVLACRNGLLHLPTMSKIDLTPRFFSTNILGYEHQPQALMPTQWLDFLVKLWAEDEQSIQTLQEWFGYCLLPDTSQEKILLMVGPKRSGKGTIARILRALLGAENTAAPTLASLGTNFGLWPLLNKTLAIISDARLSGRTDTAVVIERLLAISGEDAQTVDRKHLAPITTQLLVRFMILTNELPRLNDSSGALAGRMILLRQTKSWYGQEDTNLTGKLMAELPGILLWAIEGWQRLQERGHFIQPKSSSKVLQEMEDLSSPVGAFVREKCIIGPTCEMQRPMLFEAWKVWATERGMNYGTEAVFGRDLRAAIPTLGDERQVTVGKIRVRTYVGVRLRYDSEE